MLEPGVRVPRPLLTENLTAQPIPYLGEPLGRYQVEKPSKRLRAKRRSHLLVGRVVQCQPQIWPFRRRVLVPLRTSRAGRTAPTGVNDARRIELRLLLGGLLGPPCIDLLKFARIFAHAGTVALVDAIKPVAPQKFSDGLIELATLRLVRLGLAHRQRIDQVQRNDHVLPAVPRMISLLFEQCEFLGTAADLVQGWLAAANHLDRLLDYNRCGRLRFGDQDAGGFEQLARELVVAGRNCAPGG